MSIRSIAKKQFQLRQTEKFNEYIRSLAWSPSGDRLAVISSGGELALWQEGKVDFLQVASNSSLDCVGFSASGQYLATGGQSGKIQIWQLVANSQAFELIATLDNGSAWIDSLAWNPQQNLLAFAVNRQVKIWSGQTQSIVQDLDFAASSVFNLAWHPQGNFLAVSGHGGVKVWQSDDWEQEPYQLAVPGASLDCAWSSDGKYLASGNLDRTISLLHWDNPPPWLMQGFPGKVSQVVWSHHQDQSLLAATCQEGIIIWQFDRKSKNWQSHVLQHQKIVHAIAFAPNSSLLASTGDDGSIKLWQQGKKLKQTLERGTGLSCLAWHPQGKYLAAGAQDGALTIWQSSVAGKGFGSN
ncbi:WD40 repeat-containing protein [Xenococcus sp. PCC 7305]|uniref:WD40 repeat domain-containing protein n=1 Tax=Xenococcus sp. PCC 7305 TaxID=102125 RepID=UPI0002AC329C|nr:WD40 repeat domain-containing protein [Xenococcus sp. PCC 7305]ELS01613.1 WD40 repeat-containing protein [Xenococcus sp. PCC 7305]